MGLTGGHVLMLEQSKIYGSASLRLTWPSTDEMVSSVSDGCLCLHVRVVQSVSCRRAAHFAHYQADDEEDADNLHVGGKQVSRRIAMDLMIVDAPLADRLT